MPKDQNVSFLTRYKRGLRTSIRTNSAAFGYSLVVTADFAVLQHLVGPPSLGKIYLFLIAAAAAFAVIEALATHFFTIRARGEASEVVALGSAFSMVSISVAVGVTALVGSLTKPWLAWPLGGWASSTVYLGIVAVEMALARRLEEKADGQD